MNPKDFSIPVRAGRRFVDRRAVGTIRLRACLVVRRSRRRRSRRDCPVRQPSIPFQRSPLNALRRLSVARRRKLNRPEAAAASSCSAPATVRKLRASPTPSRRMKKSEQKACAANGVDGIIEVKIGYDGIVIAQALAGESFVLSRKDVFLGLAKQIPGADGQWVDNPHQSWRDVNPTLPAVAIRVYGPAAHFRHSRRLCRAGAGKGLLDFPRCEGFEEGGQEAVQGRLPRNSGGRRVCRIG